MTKNLKIKTLKGILLLIVFLAFNNLSAQNSGDLFMVKEIKKAYENKTRSFDGKPGINYFQNRTDYKISAEFFPKTRIIEGKEIITYKNNSPDSLSDLYVKLYQDLYKKGVSRDWDIGSVDLHDGVEIKSIKINGNEIDVNSNRVKRNSTIMHLYLLKKINPKSTNKIEIEWSLIIPETVCIRMGTYDKTNFMIAFWYPKISVYDDINGWNTIPHKGQCEYYNDYGDFDVEIIVPSDFNVWSSGVLQNTEEIFNEKYINRINKAAVSDEIVHVITKDDRTENNITKKAKKHTWKFRADYLPDFAFAVSNKYLWDASSVKVCEKRVIVNAVYKENSKDFHEVADISKKTIDYFSTKIPAIPYPYPQLTAFNGKGGMEFPGMINDGDADDRNGTLFVTSHEIGHTYFPFYVGTNEQKYAWIDEGLITFFPRKVIVEYTDEKGYNPFKNLFRSYNYYAGSFSEIPLMISSTNTGVAYRYQAYSRSSIAFYTLFELIGKENFNKGLQEYTKRWNGKHPTPYDLFFTFNEVVGEDLAWFWEPWFFDLGYADLSIGELNKKSEITELTIENKGSFPVPINLEIIYMDNTKLQFNKASSIWKNGAKSFLVEIPKGEIKKIILDTELTPDAFPRDNILEF